MIIIDQWNQTLLLYKIQVVVNSCHCDVRVLCKERVICKTWTQRTLANSADPDQMPQNAASDQGLHCLLKLQEDKG